jgi:hypothetical protein
MSVNQSSLLASLVVSAFRPDIDQRVADLTRRFPDMIAAKLRLRLWVVETILVLQAGENSTAEPARLDRFFDAFWPDLWRHLRLDLPGEEVRQEFDAGLDRLATEIEADRQGLAPEMVSIAFAKRIAEFLKVPELEPLESSYKVTTTTKLLDELPE